MLPLDVYLLKYIARYLIIAMLVCEELMIVDIRCHLMSAIRIIHYIMDSYRKHQWQTQLNWINVVRLMARKF